MPIAEETNFNELRREIKERLSDLVNDTGETISLSSGDILDGDSLFKAVSTARYYSDLVKVEDTPFISVYLGATTLSDGDKTFNLYTSRGFTASVIITRAINSNSEIDEIEDIQSYYRKRVVECLQSNDKDWINRFDMKTNSIDDVETIKGLETNLKPPLYVTAIEGTISRAGGYL